MNEGGKGNKPCSDCQGANQLGKEGASSCLLKPWPPLLQETNLAAYYKLLLQSGRENRGKCQGLEMVGCELEMANGRKACCL